MEKRQYKDYYLPFAAPKLVKSSELMKEALEQAGDYNAPDESQRLLTFAISKILEAGENIVGPAFSLQEGGSAFLPQKWLPLINYLKENKLIEGIVFELPYYDEPKIINRATILSPFDANLSDGHKPNNPAYGLGASPGGIDEAIAKAIGEFLERYSLLIYRKKDFLRASVNDLERKGKLYLDIKNLAGFSEEQKRGNNRFDFNETSDFFWLEGRSLFDNKKCLIPAQLVFWNYNFEKEPVLREQNTNGASGHYTFCQAILSGLYELIQRDGFMIYWLNGASPPQIDLATIDYEPLLELLEECRRLDFEVRFYNTTSDLGIPGCICTIFDHSGEGPKISMGGGCEMNWDRMLFRAMEEALGVYHWGRKRKESGHEFKELAEDYKPFRDVQVGQIERLNLWASKEMFSRFQFFLKRKAESLTELKKNSLKFSSPEEELNYLVAKFKSLGKGYEIFYYQASHKALKDLGYCSVKVIVPALIPLYLREIYAPLGALRLKEVPPKLGFKPADKWNSLPHPFP